MRFRRSATISRFRISNHQRPGTTISSAPARSSATSAIACSSSSSAQHAETDAPRTRPIFYFRPSSRIDSNASTVIFPAPFRIALIAATASRAATFRSSSSGTRRAIGRPSLVITIVSPRSTSSSGSWLPKPASRASAPSLVRLIRSKYTISLTLHTNHIPATPPHLLPCHDALR